MNESEHYSDTAEFEETLRLNKELELEIKKLENQFKSEKKEFLKSEKKN